MGLSYFGSDGAYTVSTSAIQAIDVNAINATSVDYGTIGSIVYGGVLGGLGSNTINQQAIPQSSLQQYLEKVSKPAKKAARGILAKLQEEIDGWHGDVLERCPA
jgi:hypothetical protein